MKQELKKFRANLNRKQVSFVILASILYGIASYDENPITLGIGLFSAMTHEQLLASIAIFPALACLFLFYRILSSNEKTSSWKTLLAYPVDQRPHIVMIMLLALLFQPIPMIVSNLMYMVLTSMVSMELIKFMVTMQILYLTAFLYYCFIMRKGYTGQGFSVSIVNPMEILTPMFLLFAILNMGSWLSIFVSIWQLSIVASMILCGYLLIRCNWYMRWKLHRELMLEKLFPAIQNPLKELAMEKQYLAIDQALQFLIHHLPFQGRNYWCIIAALEVSLKQKSYPLLLALIFMMEAFDEGNMIYLLFSSLCVCYFFFYTYQQMLKIRQVLIQDS